MYDALRTHLDGEVGEKRGVVDGAHRRGHEDGRQHPRDVLVKHLPPPQSSITRVQARARKIERVRYRRPAFKQVGANEPDTCRGTLACVHAAPDNQSARWFSSRPGHGAGAEREKTIGVRQRTAAKRRTDGHHEPRHSKRDEPHTNTYRTGTKCIRGHVPIPSNVPSASTSVVTKEYLEGAILALLLCELLDLPRVQRGDGNLG